jgi:hypothetical protein
VHLLEVLKADQNIGGNPLFLNAAVYLMLCTKEYFKANPAQAQSDREKDADLNANTKCILLISGNENAQRHRQLVTV